MEPAPKTFSESWHRVAHSEIYLRPGVHSHRQFFRGDKWYILQDPFNNEFFRVRPAAYEFLVRLRKGRTIESVWKECLELDPEHAPGQEEVIQLLSQLYQSNLLHCEGANDTQALFKRYERRRKQEIKSRLMSFMFPKFTLWDPDRFLKRTLPFVNFLMGWFGLALWLIVVGFGIKAVIDNFGNAVDQTQGILAQTNLGWLYLCLVVIKALHEFGHGYTCRKFAGEVHKMGIMLLIFTPIPFVDATSSWGVRSRRQRVLIGAAGMIVEMFVAAVAAVIWANTGEGLVHNLCYNLMFIASVSTLLFNGNPLLRFDGYYILSDLLDIPNLHQRSRKQMTYLWQRYIYGIKKAQSLAQNFREAFWLIVFGILSWLYRIFISVVIILFVADHLLVIGLLLAVLMGIAWAIVPVVRAIIFLCSSPVLHRQRTRAIVATAVVAVLVLAPLLFIPFPHYFRADGVIRARHYTPVFAPESGFLKTLETWNGKTVTPGELLVEMENVEIDLNLLSSRARLKEAEAYITRALNESRADLKPLQSAADAVKDQNEQLLDQKRRLRMAVAQEGEWVGVEKQTDSGRWVVKGTDLGIVINETAFQFYAVVPQSEANRLFDDQISKSSIKIRGQARHTLQVEKVKKIPMEMERLPSEALGLQAGGAIQVDFSDPSGVKAREPFFQVVADLVPHDDATFVHGLTGQVRFRLANEPLLPRWIRLGRQLLQKRYRI